MKKSFEALKIGNRAEDIIHIHKKGLRVHSVFKHAVNFIDRRDYLVTVLEEGNGCSSQAVTMNFRDLSFLISSPIVEGDCMDIQSLIDFRNAERIDFTLKEPVNYLDGSSIRKNVKTCIKCILESGNLSGFAASVFGFRTIYSKYVLQGLQTLKYSYINKNKKEMAEALKGFIGLGQGLTPSGDDFICGFISALFYSSGLIGLNNKWTRSMGLEVIEGAVNNTTLISYNMLRAYVNGELSEHMQFLLNCMLTSGEDKLTYSFNKVMQAGSTSGSDMASGLLFGLDLINQTGGFVSLGGGI